MINHSNDRNVWASHKITNYSRTPLFRTRLIRSPRYFEGRSNSLGFTLPLYASPVISKPRYFKLFFYFPWDFEIAGFDSTCNYHCCLWYSFHKPVWHFSWNKIPFQKNISTVYGCLIFSVFIFTLENVKQYEVKSVKEKH